MQNPNPKAPKADQPAVWTILDVLNWTTSYFKSRDIPSARLDAEVLLAHVLHADRMALYLRFDQPLSPQERAAFKAAVRRRAAREPVAYITGEKGFWDLDLAVSPAVLIPRPETECLVEKALALLPEKAGAPCSVLELGTGSGAIILSLASHRPANRYFASDLSLDALKVARENSRRHKLAVSLFAGSWFSPVKKPPSGFDLILSNPPYIPSWEISRLAPEIAVHEPKTALDGGSSGLDALFHLIDFAHLYLADHGFLLLEMGYDQKEAVLARAEAAGAYRSAEVVKDYGEKDRVLVLGK